MAADSRSQNSRGTAGREGEYLLPLWLPSREHLVDHRVLQDTVSLMWSSWDLLMQLLISVTRSRTLLIRGRGNCQGFSSLLLFGAPNCSWRMDGLQTPLMHPYPEGNWGGNMYRVRVAMCSSSLMQKHNWSSARFYSITVVIAVEKMLKTLRRRWDCQSFRSSREPVPLKAAWRTGENWMKLSPSGCGFISYITASTPC